MIYYMFSLDHKAFYKEVKAPIFEVLHRGYYREYTDIVDKIEDCQYSDAKIVATANYHGELKTRKMEI